MDSFRATILDQLRQRNYTEVDSFRVVFQDYRTCMTSAINNNGNNGSSNQLVSAASFVPSERSGMTLELKEEKVITHDVLKRLFEAALEYSQQETGRKRDAVFAKTMVSYLRDPVTSGLEVTENTLVSGFASALQGAISKNLTILHIGTSVATRREEGMKKFCEMLNDIYESEELLSGNGWNRLTRVEPVCICCLEMHSVHLRDDKRATSEFISTQSENVRLQEKITVLSAKVAEAEKNQHETQDKLNEITKERAFLYAEKVKLDAELEKRTRECLWLHRVVEQEQRRRMQESLKMEQLKEAKRTITQMQMTKDLMEADIRKLRYQLLDAKEVIRRLTRDVQGEHEDNLINAAALATHPSRNSRHTITSQIPVREPSIETPVSEDVEIISDPVLDEKTAQYIENQRQADQRMSTVRGRPISGRWALNMNVAPPQKPLPPVPPVPSASPLSSTGSITSSLSSTATIPSTTTPTDQTNTHGLIFM